MNEITCDRSPSKRTSCPIRIRIGLQREPISGFEKDALANSMLNISESVMKSLEMRRPWLLHELAQILSSETEIRSGMREVVQFAN